MERELCLKIILKITRKVDFHTLLFIVIPNELGHLEARGTC